MLLGVNAGRLWREHVESERIEARTSSSRNLTTSPVGPAPAGTPFSRDHLTYVVKERVDAAKLGKGGACHLFSHTMATLMHENGADIRHIQAILGH